MCISAEILVHLFTFNNNNVRQAPKKHHKSIIKKFLWLFYGTLLEVFFVALNILGHYHWRNSYVKVKKKQLLCFMMKKKTAHTIWTTWGSVHFGVNCCFKSIYSSSYLDQSVTSPQYGTITACIRSIKSDLWRYTFRMGGGPLGNEIHVWHLRRQSWGKWFSLGVLTKPRPRGH